MSAVEINPAGLAIFLHDQSSLSLGYRKTKIETSFFGNSINNDDEFLNFSQAGGVLVFNLRNDENWRKIALGFNYSIVNDFDNSFIIEGNSGVPDFESDPFLDDISYPNVDLQSFINSTKGLNDRFTFTLAADYNNKLFYGFSISTYNLDYAQVADLAEFNNDGLGNTLDASLIQTLQTTGTGFSLGFGIIAKPINVVRFGLSYRSPIWYDLTDFYSDDLLIDLSNDPDSFSEFSDGIFDYKITTPSIITGSFAFLFGKHGFVSFDYTYKDYQNTKLRPPSVFATENQDLSINLRGTSQYRIGAEWRLDRVSLRGGYLMEENPYKDSPTSDDLTGYSFGLGFELGHNSKLDFAYSNTRYNQPYKFLQASGPGNLDIENQRITATLVIAF